ncbi:carboxymethylenebutenolidase [Aquaspirillum sp. LM1]|uniref:dienelactone hydrolase family protein n=1 Tax=Aquaspirillum sp. LM1 TaxID=1938604 RepID=UPI000983B7B4|nr:dienelactone hydrolase family protein [Aquaspirillum sp. LM1]AQR64452.1 carboxymethylenebutenolidase [Aquaspirillum sp. LM1]
MSLDPKLHQAAIQLYDAYTHTPWSRRDFLQRLTALVGSSSAAYALLPLLENNYAQAASVPTDSRLLAQEGQFATLAGGAALSGYQVHPTAAAASMAGVVLIHENRGLNPHIRDMARRLALAGYRVLAPDYLSTQGGTPADEDQAREQFTKLDAGLARQISLAAVAALRQAGSSKVGAVGFCWGGGQVGQLAVHAPDLQAAVVYYGPAPASSDVAAIRAPLLLHYAGLDERINAGVPGFTAALQAAGARHSVYTYPGVNHAFNNDTNAARYDAAAAALAWQRTLAFLHQHLA